MDPAGRAPLGWRWFPGGVRPDVVFVRPRRRARSCRQPAGPGRRDTGPGRPAQGPARRHPGRPRSHRRRHGRRAAPGRSAAGLCGQGPGPGADLAARPGRPRGLRPLPLSHRPALRPGLGPGGTRPGQGRPHPGAGLPPPGQEGGGRVREQPVPRHGRPRGRADRRPGGFRLFHRLGRGHRRRGAGRPAAGGYRRLPHPRRDRRGRPAEERGGKGLGAEARPLLRRRGGHPGVSGEPGVRGPPDLRLGHPGRGGAQHRPGPQADQPAGAPQPGEAAGARLPATPLRSPGRDLLQHRPRLRRPPRPGHRRPGGPAVPPGEDRSHRRRLDGEEADRLLYRPRRAGADPHRPEGGRGLVGPGIRGRRLQGRLPGGDLAAGRRSPGRALQCRQLGRPGHPGLVLRPGGDRPAHRGDRQGLGPPGRAAGAPGHADLRGPGGRGPGWDRRPQ